MTASNDPVLVLKVTCTDRPGIVAAVSTVIAEQGGNILESSQFNDLRTGRFFMRVRFSFPDPARFRALFRPVGQRLEMEWSVRDEARAGRVLLLVSRLDHCLVDLLYQWRTGTIAMDLAGVVSNHDDLRGLVEASGLPFHYLPVTPEARPEQEARLLDVIERTETELVVLARYMQILSVATADALFGRAINIHHSFLPGFKGARPYHQAHARGVKLIGATAHYVTADLDEGPIIEQDVERVTHADTPEELASIGRHLEARALARAVRWHLEQRVFLNGAKTVVFR
ncbi:formyltetrahydrofolate deformylase [Aquisalimonas lutea]|uniref:formyltetrahydrofolate deformylase n=1 Tax=Aquisalimonas lutea TaxID=1327750 RepID=UPI0025B4CBFB|nr:formyltetrahydrofolate deformylase [Aquisalimonas lutea]MDN3519349.1 formyltetrahydrofolate deformylase [Aquisalimonas lutea]